MASGGKDTNYSRCSVCLDDGRDTIAKHFCLECDAFFCRECVKPHTILRTLKAHKINKVDFLGSVTKGGGDSCTGSDDIDRSGQRLRCSLHHGKLVDTYCRDHDSVCCGTCALLEHRSCTKVSIDKAANNFKSSPDVKKSQEATTATLDFAKQEKKKREDNLEGIGAQKQAMIEEVDSYEEILIAKIKELANASRADIRSKYEENKTAIDNDVETLEALMTSISAFISKLEQAYDEALLFAYVKTILKVIRDGEALLHDMEEEWKQIKIAYCLDKSLETTVNGITTLGRMEDSIVANTCKAKFVKNISIKERNETESHVNGICLMNSREIIVADSDNKKLKRFSSDLIYKDELVMSDCPASVCTVGKDELAVRIRHSKIVHFVSVSESMQLTSTFTLSAMGWGITFDVDTGELFAAEENKVSVYSKSGTLLRTYGTCANGGQIFSQCRQITLSDNKQDIYVTDENKGLIVLDSKNGTLKMKVDVPGVSKAWPLCLLPGGICLVGGYLSGVIAQLDRGGKTIGKLIESNDGRTYTDCTAYDHERGRLLIGGNPSVISVYNISAK